MSIFDEYRESLCDSTRLMLRMTGARSAESSGAYQNNKIQSLNLEKGE
jgi:hypothetical protein